MTEESPFCVGLHFSRQCDLVRDNMLFGMTRRYLDSLEESVFGVVCLFFLDSKKKIARCKVTWHRAIVMDDFRAPPPCR